MGLTYLETQERDKEIYREYLDAPKPVDKYFIVSLANKYKLTVQRIYQILAEKREVYGNQRP